MPEPQSLSTVLASLLHTSKGESYRITPEVPLPARPPVTPHPCLGGAGKPAGAGVELNVFSRAFEAAHDPYTKGDLIEGISEGMGLGEGRNVVHCVKIQAGLLCTPDENCKPGGQP